MKILKAIINGILSLIVVITVLLLILLFIGIEPFVVLSGSMEPKIETGSLCFINKKVKYEDIKEDDIIAFKMSDKTLVTHRVVEITDEGFVTKGDANDVNDGAKVTRNNFVGKTVICFPKIGYLISLFQTRNGQIITITIIVIMFVVAFLFGEDDKKKKEKETIKEESNNNVETEIKENKE